MKPNTTAATAPAWEPDIIGVVGAGVMGSGIAQLLVAAGHEVRLFDSKPGAAREARSLVARHFDRMVSKGSFDTDHRDAALRRLTVLDDIAALAPCSIVIEAIVEDLAMKQTLFRCLEDVVRPAAILASNTSSLSVSAIASACRTPARVAGLHFFNPVPLMKLVEIIPGLLTDGATTERLATVIKACGHSAVFAADQPGFLVNHAGRALYTEGLRILEENVASVAAIDLIMRESCGFRMGPFELLDLTGLDVSGKVMQSIFEQFQHDPRYRPSSLVPPRIAAGLFGRKMGRGFYTYRDGNKVTEPEPLPPPPCAGSLWFGTGEGVEALAERMRGAGATIAAAADKADAILIFPWGEDVAGASTRLGLDPARTMALDPIVPWGRRQVLMASPATDPARLALVHGWLAAAGTTVTCVRDSVGFVAQRVIAMIVNIGCEIAQRGIASPRDIDAAVRIGLGYPSGPLALGDELGPARILAILRGLEDASGDPRYRPSPWLRRRTLLRLSLSNQERPEA